MTTGQSSVFEVPPAAGRLWVSLLVGLGESGPAPCGALPEVWFSNDAEHVAMAQRWCAECPARAACLAYAEAAGERHGVWGGVAFDRQASKRLAAS